MSPMLMGMLRSYHDDPEGTIHVAKASWHTTSAWDRPFPGVIHVFVELKRRVPPFDYVNLEVQASTEQEALDRLEQLLEAAAL